MRSDKETHYRSIIKALSWRLFATAATILIVFIFTERIMLSLEIGLTEVIVKLILYYFHERIWSFFSIGTKNHPLSHLAVNQSLNSNDHKIIEDKLKELGYIK